MGMPAQICTHSEFCGKGLAIEKNGDIYSCDHYVYPEYQIGNIEHAQLSHLAFSNGRKRLAWASAIRCPTTVKTCPYLETVLGRMPEKPPGARTGRRVGTELSLPGH